MASEFNFNFTQEHLAEIMPTNKFAAEWYEALYKVLPNYDITSVERVAAFLAQCGHESASFTVLKENLNYRATSLRKVFGKYFPTDALAEDYASRANKQEAIANRVYANRMGNGPEESGDGYRFCGRGLIQLTGRNNYTSFAESINMPVDELPEFLATFEGAIASACWYWDTNNLNQWADNNDMLTLTKRINGGTNGLEDRISHYNHATQVLQA